MKGNRRKSTSLHAALVAIALLALLLYPARLALGDAQPGAGEVKEAEDLEPIWLFDGQGELLKFVIQDNDVRGYSKGNVPIEMEIGGAQYPDGELDLDELIAYRAVQLGIVQLWPEDMPDRENLTVFWTSPSPDMEGMMEYITGCVSRDAYDIDVPGATRVENLSLDNYRFGFTDIEEAGKEDANEFETRVKEEVLPEDFFDLRTRFFSLKATVEEEYQYLERWEEARELFLTEDAETLFEVEKEEEPVPFWPLTFSLALLFGVVVTTVYGSVRGKK